MLRYYGEQKSRDGSMGLLIKQRWMKDQDKTKVGIDALSRIAEESVRRTMDNLDKQHNRDRRTE